MDMEAVEASGRNQRPDQGPPHSNIPNVLKMSRSDSTVSPETEHEQMTAGDAVCTLTTLGVVKGHSNSETNTAAVIPFFSEKLCFCSFPNAEVTTLHLFKAPPLLFHHPADVQRVQMEKREKTNENRKKSRGSSRCGASRLLRVLFF